MLHMCASSAPEHKTTLIRLHTRIAGTSAAACAVCPWVVRPDHVALHGHMLLPCAHHTFHGNAALGRAIHTQACTCAPATHQAEVAAEVAALELCNCIGNSMPAQCASAACARELGQGLGAQLPVSPFRVSSGHQQGPNLC